MSQKSVGILGGGQLSLMLAEAALHLRHPTFVLANTSDPVSHCSATLLEGGINSQEAIQNILEKVDVATIESEFLDVNILDNALNSISKKTYFFPFPRTIRITQDKLSQKELFNRLHLLSAKHRVLSNEDDLDQQFKELLEDYSNGFILKWSRLGYDGKGNFVFNSMSDASDAKSFCKLAFDKQIKVYAEEKIHFQYELAMIYVRPPSGKTVHYPLVISEQTHGICKIIQGPATKLGIPPRIQSDAVDIGYAIGETAQIIGTYAIEFFYSEKQGLLINEMAPRVHNSGHYTLASAHTSQFENHIRAIAGLPLGSTDTLPYFGMLNLIGPDNVEKTLSPTFRLPAPLSRQLVPYWYHKSELKPGRKMGHISLKASSLEELFSGIIEMKSYEENIWKNLT